MTTMKPASLTSLRHDFLVKVSDLRDGNPPPHPGEILREDFLPRFYLSAAKLAGHLDVPVEKVVALLGETESITPDLAWRLGAALRTGTRYWLTLQLQYDLWQAEFDANGKVPPLDTAM